MKLFRAATLSAAVLFFALAASLRVPVVFAQAQNESSQERPLDLQITANDEIAAANVSGHQMHLRPVRGAAG